MTHIGESGSWKKREAPMHENFQFLPQKIDSLANKITICHVYFDVQEVLKSFSDVLIERGKAEVAWFKECI